jgi:hypothetical protein
LHSFISLVSFTFIQVIFSSLQTSQTPFLGLYRLFASLSKKIAASYNFSTGGDGIRERRLLNCSSVSSSSIISILNIYIIYIYNILVKYIKEIIMYYTIKYKNTFIFNI